MKTKKSSKRLEAERKGLSDGFIGDSPAEFFSHYYPRSYNRGYRKGMKIARESLRRK